MDNSSTGKIECSKPVQPTVRIPYPVRNGIVDERGPEKDKYYEGAKTNALCEGSNDQRRGNNRKHSLEDHIRQMRNGRCIGRIGSIPHTMQAEEIQTSQQSATNILSERQTIAEEDPLDTHQGQYNHRLFDHTHDILAAYHPAIKKSDGGC